MKYLLIAYMLGSIVIFSDSSAVHANNVEWCVVNNATGKVSVCYRMKQICENSIKSVTQYYSCVAR